MNLGSWLACTLAFVLGSFIGDSEKYLTASVATEHFDIKYRPDSRAGASVDYVAARAEEEFARITRALDLQVDARFDLYLYDDVAELQKITCTEGNAGFSAGSAMHMPYDNDQTRMHEMVHVIAVHFPKEGEEKRSLFFAEGLSNALLEFVTGVHVHAVTAFERRRGKLPPLAEMTQAPDFYTWLREHPNIGAYDLAGSWFRFLLDRFGPADVKRYYTGVPAEQAFGESVTELEASWHALLDAYELRPEVQTLMNRRRGLPGRFSEVKMHPDAMDLPAEVLGAPEQWTAVLLQTMQPATASEWSLQGDSLRGSHPQDADWSVCKLGEQLYGDCVVRARILPDKGCIGVQLRLGSGCQAMLTNAGTFVYAQSVTAAQQAERIDCRETIDLCMRRIGDELTIWIDGKEILRGKAGDSHEVLGVGVAGGRATFEEVQVREL